MSSRIGSSSHLIQTIPSTYPLNEAVPHYEPLENNPPQAEPSPPEENGGFPPIDPLAAIDLVDTDDEPSISEDEYIVLKAMMSQITGNVYTRDFSDFDADQDNQLNSEEVKSVLDVTGFKPPLSPTHTIISAYQAQHRSGDVVQSRASSGLEDLLCALKTRGGGIDISA